MHHTILFVTAACSVVEQSLQHAQPVHLVLLACFGKGHNCTLQLLPIVMGHLFGVQCVCYTL